MRRSITSLAVMSISPLKEMTWSFLSLSRAIIFSNWVGIRTKILDQAKDRSEVVIDLSYAHLVDHSVMEKLHELERDFKLAGKKLTVTGLDNLTPLSNHPTGCS